MKRAIVHFGLPKTGSSSLQSFLDSSVTSLSQNNIFYQPTPFSASTIHSGNGGPLFELASDGDHNPLLEAIRSLVEPLKSISIISCELFCHLDETALTSLVSALSVHFSEITYIGYVRDLSSYYYGEYTQSLKRHDETRSFLEFVKENRLTAYSFPKRLRALVRESDRICLRAYTSGLGFCIISDFLEFLEIPDLLPPCSRLNLNRSLTPFESQIFRFLNFQRKLSNLATINSKDLSDLYLQIHQDALDSAPIVSHQILNIIYERHGEDIEFIEALLPPHSGLGSLDQEKARIDALARDSMSELDGLLLEKVESQNVRSLMHIYEAYKMLLS